LAGVAVPDDVEFHHLTTDYFPLEGGVALEDLGRRLVRDAAEDVSAGAVRRRQADEGSQVVPAAVPQAKRDEIALEPVARVLPLFASEGSSAARPRSVGLRARWSFSHGEGTKGFPHVLRVCA
jgi:hypothetical protein